MSKTYTLTPTSINAGRRSSISTYWTNFQAGEAGGLVTGYGSKGYSSAYYRLVNFMFDEDELASFSGKTITSITLRITVSSGTLGSSSYPYRLRYKYDDVATTSASSDSWASGTYDGSAYDDTDLDTWSNGASSGTTTITSGTTHDFDCGTTLPAYGYVLGGRTGNAYMVLTTACYLYITTTETDYTMKLAYSANGGSGAPSTQSTTVTTTGTPSTTFTVSSTVPTRTGYSFTEWNTASDGSGTSYDAGDSITVSGSGSTTVTLYAQWEALKSTLNSISSGTIGSTVSVSWTAQSSSFTHTLTFTLGSTTTSAVSISAGTSSYTFSIPSSWLSLLPSSTSGTATATLTTLVDGTSIGTSTATFTVNVDSSVVPTIGSLTATKVNSSATVETWDIYLQNYSQVLLTASTLAAGTGASLTSIRFTGQNIDSTTSSPSSSATATSNTITASGSLTYTATLTDSRGRTGTATVTISVSAYAVPSISSFVGYRCDSDGTTNPTTGESLKATPTFSITSVGSNTQTNVIDYKKTTDNSWTTAVSNTTSGTTSVFASGTADQGSSYYVRFTVTDSLYNSATYTITISSVVGIAFGLYNDRARFGGVTRQAGLEVDWDSQFDGDVEVQGDLTVNGNPVVLTVNSTAPDANGNVNVSGSGAVDSVNGQTGTVVLDASDVGAVDLAGDTMTGTLTVPALSVTGNETVGGTLDVDGATTLNGILDITNRRAYAKLSSAGWYRVCQYAGVDSGAITGGTGEFVEFHIQKPTSSENHSIEMRMNSSSDIVFVNERSHTVTQLISKIRYTYDSTNLLGYVDIYYTGTVNRAVGVDFVVHGQTLAHVAKWTSCDLEAVDDAPSGETVVTTYSFYAERGIDVGTIYNSSGNISSLATATWASACSLTLDAGTYIIMATGAFASNSTGYRRVNVYTSAGVSTDMGYYAFETENAVDGAITIVRNTFPLTVSSTTTYYMNCYQNSGSAINVYGRFYAIRIA